MRTNNIKKLAQLSIIASSLIAFATSCRKDSVNKSGDDIVLANDTLIPNISSGSSSSDQSDNSNLLLGNPTDALRLSTYTTNYFINLGYYATSYNSTRGIPNWVSWHLSKSDVGSTSRQDDFRPYTALPSGWYQVLASSYEGSTTLFTRGHNCPSGDRTSTVAANSSTFYMINMVPQSNSMNSGPWGRVESVIRDSLVKGSNKEAFIISGNYGAGGKNTSGTYYTTLDNGHVTVPSHIWKVAIIIDNGNNDLDRIDSNATVIAIDMPNEDDLYTTNNAGMAAWRNYITTIADIENNAQSLGLNWDLLKNVRPLVKAYLKTKKYE